MWAICCTGFISVQRVETSIMASFHQVNEAIKWERPTVLRNNFLVTLRLNEDFISELYIESNSISSIVDKFKSPKDSKSNKINCRKTNKKDQLRVPFSDPQFFVFQTPNHVKMLRKLLDSYPMTSSNIGYINTQSVRESLFQVDIFL